MGRQVTEFRLKSLTEPSIIISPCSICDTCVSPSYLEVAI
jgi:hypothetical protein